jgi:hypothetical protein
MDPPNVVKTGALSRQSRYEHIDELFSKNVDGGLIETYLPDMLRVLDQSRAHH